MKPKSHPAQPLRTPLADFPFTPAGCLALADALDDVLPGAPPHPISGWLRGCGRVWGEERKS